MYIYIEREREACLIASRVHFAADVSMALGKIEMGVEGAIEELLVSVMYIYMHVYIYVRMYIGVPHRQPSPLCS